MALCNNTEESLCGRPPRQVFHLSSLFHSLYRSASQQSQASYHLTFQLLQSRRLPSDDRLLFVSVTHLHVVYPVRVKSISNAGISLPTSAQLESV